MAQPAFPKEDGACVGRGVMEGAGILWRVGCAGWGGHHEGQSRVFELQHAAAFGDRDVNGARHDAVRMNVPAVPAAGTQDVGPH